MTRISFIMPTFNRAHFIGESLQAILTQMGEFDELLVVDDGSSDGTAEVVRAVGDRARYVRQDNAGKSVALNRALGLTDGEFVWICDDDDVLRPGAVDLLSKAIVETGVDFVFGRYTRFTESPDGSRTDLGTGYWPDLSAGTLVRHILEDAFVMQNAALVRRKCYDAVGPFDETMLRSLDYEMFVRLALACSGHYVDATIFDQRKHEGARGPAKALHAVANSYDVWLNYDRRIFQKVYETVPLAFFEAMFESDDRTFLRRAALLQRGCILARHDLWPEALGDFEAAAALAPHQPLTSAERTVCGRVLNGKHDLAGVSAQATGLQFRRLYQQGLNGKAVIKAILDGALWRLRSADPKTRSATRDFFFQAVGLYGVIQLIFERLGPASTSREVQLMERRTISV
jgi:glycosyltransferase involved in cell wall biosynthesis